MGEVPIFTTKAHVFLIDPVTKKSWIPASKTAIPVNFFFDSSRQTYRIISVEGSKAVINSTVTDNMTFTKTSTKFGQWADVRANTVYGLGFGSDQLLNKFSEQFDEIRERAKKMKDQPPEYRSSGDTHAPVAPVPLSQTNGTRPAVLADDSKTSTTRTKKEEILVQKENDEDLSISSASDDSRSTSNQSAQSELRPNNQSAHSELKHVRYQNDRLKLALAQSSTNAKKWETELQALKNTNARLTTALQESMSNVDQWHRQLAMYKDENDKMKRRVNELEVEVTKGHELAEQNLDLRRQMEVERKEKKEREQECNLLQQRVDVLTVVENQHSDLSVRLKQSHHDIDQLKNVVARLEQDLENTSNDRAKRQLDAQHILGNLADKLTDITELTQKLQVTL